MSVRKRMAVDFSMTGVDFIFIRVRLLERVSCKRIKTQTIKKTVLGKMRILTISGFNYSKNTILYRTKNCIYQALKFRLCDFFREKSKKAIDYQDEEYSKFPWL